MAERKMIEDKHIMWAARDDDGKTYFYFHPPKWNPRGKYFYLDNGAGGLANKNFRLKRGDKKQITMILRG